MVRRKINENESMIMICQIMHFSIPSHAADGGKYFYIYSVETIIVVTSN